MPARICQPAFYAPYARSGLRVPLPRGSGRLCGASFKKTRLSLLSFFLLIASSTLVPIIARERRWPHRRTTTTV
jgi:hypothetical protein